ncbi:MULTISPECIES: hypothetical protein [unclassified Bartonella]|nr:MULTISPECIES: hypothetical protein [unclassified Bartonella]
MDFFLQREQEERQGWEDFCFLLEGMVESIFCEWVTMFPSEESGGVI